MIGDVMELENSESRPRGNRIFRNLLPICNQVGGLEKNCVYYLEGDGGCAHRSPSAVILPEVIQTGSGGFVEKELVRFQMCLFQSHFVRPGKSITIPLEDKAFDNRVAAEKRGYDLPMNGGSE
jgi:hypothetical protein